MRSTAKTPIDSFVTSFLASALVGTLALFATSANAELYRWVDENGRVHYGDRVPPKYAKTTRQKLNNEGMVTETLDRELTDDELVEAARLKEIEHQKQLKLEEQERYDAFLVSTYESPSQLVQAREERLTTLDGQIVANQKGIEDTERILQELKARAAKRTEAGQKVPTALKKQIAQWDDQLVKGVRAVELLRDERSKAEAQFKHDLQRYMFLKGIE